MKKLFCAVLAALMLLSLTACDALMPARKLEGSWKTKVEESREYTLQLLENFEFYEEEIALIKTPLYTVKYLTFNRDKSYSYATRAADEAACAREFVSGFFDDLYEGRESLSACYEFDMTALSKEAFLQFYADLYEVKDFDGIVNLWLETSNPAVGEYETGTFQITPGKIHMTVTDDEDNNGFVSYTLENGTLTLTYADSVEIYTKIDTEASRSQEI